MSTSRPKLTLDEQSFQDMLAAAFTIQEHNAKRRRIQPAEQVCVQCGGPVRGNEQLCVRCVGEEQRPGEQLQRKWASMWLMSQEQAGFESPGAPLSHNSEATPPQREEDSLPEPFQIPEHPVRIAADLNDASHQQQLSQTVEEAEEDFKIAGDESNYAQSYGVLTKVSSYQPPPDIPADDMELAAVEPEIITPVAAPWNLRDLRLRLRFHRADLYLVVAIVVSTFAMIWVLSAAPVGAAQRRPRLRPWERALVSLGLADAPEPLPRRGNPNIQVWVDPKTALYYCVGEELYGKAPGGHATTQYEAQMDQYEPASRAACE